MSKTSLLVLIVLVVVSMTITVAKADGIQVLVDQKAVNFDMAPVNDNGRVLVPIRAIFEAMGAQVVWDEKTQTATAVKDKTTIVIQVGSKTATINGTVKPLDISAKIVSDRILIPLRFVSESLGGVVQWDAKKQIATISMCAQPASPSCAPAFDALGILRMSTCWGADCTLEFNEIEVDNIVFGNRKVSLKGGGLFNYGKGHSANVEVTYNGTASKKATVPIPFKEILEGKADGFAEDSFDLRWPNSHTIALKIDKKPTLPSVNDMLKFAVGYDDLDLETTSSCEILFDTNSYDIVGIDNIVVEGKASYLGVPGTIRATGKMTFYCWHQPITDF